MTERAPLPAAFRESMKALLGEERAAELFAALDSKPSVSIRENASKGYEAQGRTVGWCESGRYLDERPQFTLDPLLHAGLYYVQEAASMFIEQAYHALPEKPQRVLDLCAAPGGKSTLWRSLMPDGALLVCNEPVYSRAMILRENLAKWGQPDVVVTNRYGRDFAPLTGFFDVIAADVPCSGEGMFRKDDGAREEWTAESPVRCSTLQREIIRDVWPALRTGGYLVYSTCTFNREEDEDNIIYICNELGAELVPIPLKPEWNIEGDTTGRALPVYHFFPTATSTDGISNGSHKGTESEGFFLALLRKTAESASLNHKKKKSKAKEVPLRNVKGMDEWLHDGADYKLTAPDAENIHAVRRTLADDIDQIRKTVKTLNFGIHMATAKGAKWMPTQELALSTQLRKEAFPCVDVDLETALRYLRREAITIDAPRGYVIIAYKGHPLGFVNNLGNRSNNMYPAEWRIRTL